MFVCLFVLITVSVKNASINHLNLRTIICRTHYLITNVTMNQVLIRQTVSLFCPIAEPLPDK